MIEEYADPLAEVTGHQREVLHRMGGDHRVHDRRDGHRERPDRKLHQAEFTVPRYDADESSREKASRRETEKFIW